MLAAKIFTRFAKKNSNPTTELIYHSNFELLIAVMLSAQATDISVNKATKNLFVIANTPAAMLQLGEKKLQEQIKSIGLYRSKAANIIKTCAILVTKYNAQVPQKRAELMELPGVGRKTANVILNTAFKQPTIAVDTHIFRVANRLGLANAATPLAVEQQLLQCIPKKFLLNAHHWLILHGRYICKARKPLCNDCMILDLCNYKQNNN